MKSEGDAGAQVVDPWLSQIGKQLRFPLKSNGIVHSPSRHFPCHGGVPSCEKIKLTRMHLEVL